MTTPKTIDFDAFRKEQAAEPVKLTIGGKQYELPASLPATLALDIVRIHDSMADDSDVKPEDLMRVGAGLFGGEAAFRKVLEDGKVTMSELPDLVKMVVDGYTSGVVDPNPATEEPTPASR